MSVEIERKKAGTKTGEARTLRSLIQDFERQGAHPALINFKASTSDTMSYGTMLQNIKQMAAGFAEHGLKQGQSVVFFAPNSPAWIICALSVIYFGGVAVPMDSQQSDEVLRHIIDDSKAKFICTNKKLAERVKHLYMDKGPKIILLDASDDERNWKKMLATALPESALPEMRQYDFTLQFYTSGTTGMPKGVPLTHANILLQLDSVISKTDLLRPGDRVLLPLPFFHVYPLNIGLFAPFLMGLPIILPRSLTGPEIKRAINEGKVTVVIGVPRLLRSLFQAIESKFHANKVVGVIFDALLYFCAFLDIYLRINLGKYLFYPVHKQLGPTLRMFTSGGAPLEAPLAMKLRGLGYMLACGYGLTETSPLLAIRMPANPDIAGAGEAISGVELRIQPLEDEDAEGGKSPDGQGEIQARGPNVFGGYHMLPAKTREAFTEDGWFKTGDLGFFKGKQLHIVGRASSTIVMEGGEKIQPDDIEDRLSKLPGMSEVALLQVEHKLVALVVPDPKAGPEQSSRQAIAKQLKESTHGHASYLTITDFALTEEPLPRTNLGKVKRFQLKELYEKAKGAGKGGSTESGASGKKEPGKNEPGKNEPGKNEPDAVDAAAAGKQSGRPEQGGNKAQDEALLQDPAARKCLDWLRGRFPGEEITFDTSPQIDLGIDSLEWMNLTFELVDQTGVELTEDAINKVSTVRDLLVEVTAASQGNAGADQDEDDERLSPVEDPETYLDEKEKSYVKILTPHEANRPRWLYNFIMTCMRPFEVEAYGMDKLPEGQFVLTPNHESYIDAFSIIAVMHWARLQKTQWAGWVGIAYGNPVFSYLSRLGGVIPIDAQHSLVKSLALSSLALKNGKNLVWFPEGERALNGKLLDFKPGIGMLVEKLSVPVVPVYLEGTAKALPPGHWWPTKHKIRVYFGEPVDAETLKSEGAKLAESKKVNRHVSSDARDANSAFTRVAQARQAKQAKKGSAGVSEAPDKPESDASQEPDKTAFAGGAESAARKQSESSRKQSESAAQNQGESGARQMTGAEQIAAAIQERVEKLKKKAKKAALANELKAKKSA